MKNKIKYFVLYPLMLLIVIATLTYDVKELIGLGQRIPFGSSYWKDSLTNGISTNKDIYSHSIRMNVGDSLYYNGVVVTSGTGGGGIAASDNITFTGRDSTTELWRFGDSVRFYDHVLFKDTLKVSNAIAIFDSAKIGVDVSMLSDSSGINWTSGGLSQIYQLPSPASILAFKQNEFDFFTKKGNQILYLDSLNGMTLNYGVFTGNGSQLTNVDAITLKGQDTTHFARTDTLTTERVKSKTEFSDVVTFFLSPVFSALVTFANGISVTGNATISGYTQFGDSTNTMSLKFCEVKGKIGTGTNQNYTFPLPAHLLGNGFKRIVTWQANIRNDSAVGGGKKNIAPNSWYGNSAYYATIDSGNCVVGLTATSNAVNDSVFFAIWYRSNGTSGE